MTFTIKNTGNYNTDKKPGHALKAGTHVFRLWSTKDVKKIKRIFDHKTGTSHEDPKKEMEDWVRFSFFKVIDLDKDIIAWTVKDCRPFTKITKTGKKSIVRNLGEILSEDLKDDTKIWEDDTLVSAAFAEAEQNQAEILITIENTDNEFFPNKFISAAEVPDELKGKSPHMPRKQKRDSGEDKAVVMTPTKKIDVEEIAFVAQPELGIKTVTTKKQTTKKIQAIEEDF